MTIPSPKPSPEGSDLDELGRVIESMTEAAATRPPGRPGGPPPSFLWGPSSPRTSPSQTITSPLQMLAEVANHAQRLHEQMLALVGVITGEAPPPLRLRQVPRPGGGLLPNVALLAHEIETVHAEIAGLIGHLRGRL